MNNMNNEVLAINPEAAIDEADAVSDSNGMSDSNNDSTEPNVESDKVEKYNGKDRGYALIEGLLVPFSFLHFLNQRCSAFYAYGVVLSPREMIGEDDWLELSDEERQVAGACLMHLIDVGDVKVLFTKPINDDSHPPGSSWLCINSGRQDSASSKPTSRLSVSVSYDQAVIR